MRAILALAAALVAVALLTLAGCGTQDDARSGSITVPVPQAVRPVAAGLERAGTLARGATPAQVDTELEAQMLFGAWVTAPDLASAVGWQYTFAEIINAEVDPIIDGVPVGSDRTLTLQVLMGPSASSVNSLLVDNALVWQGSVSGITIAPDTLNNAGDVFLTYQDCPYTDASGLCEIWFGTGSGSGAITGTVVNALTSAALSGASVSVSGTSLSATTDSAGAYSISAVPAGSHTVTASLSGYADGSTTVTVTAGATTAASAISLTPTTTTATGTVTGTVVSATSGLALSSVTVSASGVSTTTNSSGAFTLSGVAEGSRTVTASLSGYTSASVTVTVTANASTSAGQIALSPALSSGELRVVLTWGSTPSDLDLHALTPSSEHIYYANDTGTNISLDVDDTDGFGPETITVTVQAAGTYTFFVHNFSAETALSDSSAVVKVYTDAGLQNTISVPAGSGSNEYWNVLTSNGGAITVVNTFQASEPSVPAGAAAGLPGPKAP